MSCLKPESISSDSSPVRQNLPTVESSEEYSELVQQSYEQLFGPWLESAENEAAEARVNPDAEVDSTHPSN
jgi:hypothetical protein